MKNQTTPKYKNQVIEDSINQDQKIKDTVNKIINKLDIRDYLNSNWSKIYEKIIDEYNKLEGDNENKFTSLIEKMKYDINDIVLNYSVVSPLTLKAVIDKIMNDNNLKDKNDRSKVSISIFMSILLYILFMAIKDNKIKNEGKASITDLIKLIYEYTPISFSTLAFNS